MININNIKTTESSSAELGIAIDSQLTFKDHINILCHRPSIKLHELRRRMKYLTTDKTKLLYNAL